ncbi:MAG: B12-binding domain-containing radical SAM protein [Clostridium sp.]|nr:B12-binding domain-containing radical SAM protein [Clostridium sp.]
MKIILVALNAKYVHSNLAVYTLEAYAREQLNRAGRLRSDRQQAAYTQCEEAEIIVKEYTINHNLDMILQSLYQEKAAVVAFSCYIWNIHENLIIARELHKVSQNTHIWLGGPEVSYGSRKLLEENTFVEGIMQGEGEVTFYELVELWNKIGEIESKNVMNDEAGRDNMAATDLYREVPGIIYRDKDNGIHQNPPRELMSLDEVPFIYHDLSKFQNKILYYETSRGCPFSCSYCLSSIDKQVRLRSMELVKKELRFFLDAKVPQVKLIDRTFNCQKKHALAVWQFLLEHDNGLTNFHFEVAADLIGEEELAVFKQMRPGLIQLEIGLQSTNLQTIQAIRRVMNVDKLRNIMLTIQEFGNIHQHLDLIAGLPYEDFVSFKQSFNDAYEMKPNQLQLGFLKVLKGSYLEEQIEEYELKYQDFPPYEVLSTKWISYDDILALKKVEEMVEVYRNSGQFMHALSYLITFFESPYAFYEALGEYYACRQLFGIGFKRETRYEVLREFSANRLVKCENDDRKYSTFDEVNRNVRNGNVQEEFSAVLLDDLLTFDYYLRENAKSRPSWAKAEPIGKSAYQAFFKNGGTEEAALGGDGYDSKTAARAMHIEPVSGESIEWLWGEETARACRKEKESGEWYCLFDYEHRNPLSKDAAVKLLSHL